MYSVLGNNEDGSALFGDDDMFLDDNGKSSASVLGGSVVIYINFAPHRVCPRYLGQDSPRITFRF